MTNVRPSLLLKGLMLGVLSTGLPACGLMGGTSLVRATQRTALVADMVFMKPDPSLKPLGVGSATARSLLPARVDMRAKMSPVFDQGRMNSCTGVVMAGLAEFLAMQRGDSTRLSPAFVYLNELKTDGSWGRDAGSYIRTGMTVLQEYGIAPEALCPYATSQDLASEQSIWAYLQHSPSRGAQEAALPYRISGFTGVSSFGDFKAALANGKPVPFLMTAYPGFRSEQAIKTGWVPVPDLEHERPLGLHALLAVGYDDEKQVIIVRQSRGPDWGDKGYGYLPYSYFNEGLVFDAWLAN